MTENAKVAAFADRLNQEVERQAIRMRQQRELTDLTVKNVLSAGLRRCHGQITMDEFLRELRSSLDAPLLGSCARNDTPPESKA